ncbi:MAG: hypothetical protein ACT4PM_06665 [Gemmatimonadales bacterium]
MTGGAAGGLGSVLLALAAACVPPALAAQAAPGGAQLILEWGGHGTLTIADSTQLGFVGGPRLAIRTLGGTRGAVSAGVGVLGDSLSARFEGALEYQLAPRAAGRVGVYFGGGLAGVVGRGRGSYLLLYAGLEQSPGRGGGWAVEAGLGGGFRFRAAYHWRRFPRGWTSR